MDEYDVIVVGAGSAGSVLTRRLVDAGRSVLLLESGGEDTGIPDIHQPAANNRLWGTGVDWNYHTAPQAALAGRRLHWPRGRVLGGSSALNAMIYARGVPADYDTWAYLGNPGWAYQDVLPRFRRSEDFDRGADPFHGAGGPIRVQSRYQPHPVTEALVESAVALGIPYNQDYNGAAADGVSFCQLTVKDGRRHSAYGAFVAPVRHRTSLTVRTGARVRRLLIAGARCTGVELSAGGTVQQARAGEVVLCAGVIESPKLLLLSGVGPAGALRELGVPVLVDAPEVGANLHDHPLAPVIVAARRPVPGPVPGLPVPHAHLFWRSRAGLRAPDLQPLFFHAPLYQPGMTGPEDAFTLMAGAIRPTSRGRLTLASADPEAAPRLDPRYLSTDADLDAMVAAVQLCREIAAAASAALAQWRGAELYPGPQVRDRAELVGYLRRHLVTYHHQVGTCRMGADAGAVVDPQLRVRGVERLRVADASIMPIVPSGNTAAPAMMVGETAAELLLAPPASSPANLRIGIGRPL